MTRVLFFMPTIVVPSRLSSPPPRALSAVRYITPEKHMPPQSEPLPVHRSLTRIPAPQAGFSINSSLHPPTPDSLCTKSDTLPSVETRRAWEEKQPTSFQMMIWEEWQTRVCKTFTRTVEQGYTFCCKITKEVCFIFKSTTKL